MSTRTAIFKEQDNGSFLGIYCHHDGYIEGVGYTLLEYYKDPAKTQKLINMKRSLSSLGQETEIKERYDKQTGELLCEVDCERYCTAFDVCYEQYYAESLEQVQTLDYYTLDENGVIQGYTKDSISGEEVFTAYRGSDNNGYVYVQLVNGEWLVSEFEKTFKKLTK